MPCLSKRGFGCIVLAFTVTFVFGLFSCLCLSFLSLELSSVHTSFEIVDWVLHNSHLAFKEHGLTFNNEIVWTQHVFMKINPLFIELKKNNLHFETLRQNKSMIL